MSKPLVSILLPTYNAAPYLKECLESIDHQDYPNKELIAIDDCSTDDSFNILKNFAQGKSWAKIYQNPQNLGVSPTFNKAVSLAHGDYLARMDADDIMLPHRLSLQSEYLKDNSQTVIVGGQCQIIDKDGKVTGKKTFPTNHKQIKDMLFRTVPLQQPTIMINKGLLPKNFLYGNPKFSPAEDYGLFFAALKYGHLANLSQETLQYREHQTNISLTRPKFTFWRIWRARLDGILNQGYRPSLKSWIIVLAQTLAILILPQRLIYPLHKFLRGMK